MARNVDEFADLDLDEEDDIEVEAENEEELDFDTQRWGDVEDPEEGEW